jgi:hypothetical protein
MRKEAIIGIVIIILLIAVLGTWSLRGSNPKNEVPGNQATSTEKGENAPYDQSISDGTITVYYPSSDFGLAVTKEQVLVTSYIPPCDEGFDYCLYYVGNAFKGTNFESAGLRIQKRPDLTAETQCLNTQPSGYSGLVPATFSSSDYATSAFSPVGGAGAGHFASGSLYRLYYNRGCWEFETRVGQSQFLNYPSGTIREFTASDEQSLISRLRQILSGVRIPSGETVSFPK